MVNFQPAMDCSHYRGYCPCVHQKEAQLPASPHCKADELICSTSCPEYRQVKGIVLVVDIGGIGTLIRLSPLLKKLKKEGILIYFLGAEKSRQLCDEKHPLLPEIDRFFTNCTEDIEYLSSLHFQKIVNYESGQYKVTAWVSTLKCDEYYGFRVDCRTGNVVVDMDNPGERQMMLCQIQNSYRRQLNLPFQRILLEMAGFSGLSDQEIWMEVQLHDQLHEEARVYIESLIPNRDLERNMITLNIGTAYEHRAKRWAAPNFYFLAQEMPEYDFLVISGPDDEDALQVLQALHNANPLPNLYFTEQMSLSLLAHVIYECDAVVSAETMVSNLAISLPPNWKGKILIVSGPQPPWEVYFQGKPGNILHKDLACAPCYRGVKCLWQGTSDDLLCMKIPVQQVREELTQLLEP